MRIVRHRRGVCRRSVSFLDELLQYVIDMYHWQRRQNAGVDLPMADETGFLSERLAAYIARVDTLAGVQKEVLTQAAVPGERSAADRAAVRLVARVNPHVLPQVVILEECLATLLAYRLFFPLVLRQHVLIQILLRDEASVAQRAFVLRLVMRVLLMGVQAVAVPAGLTANVAHHRRLPMIQPGVRGEIALDLELFAAVLARVTVVLGVLADEVRPQGLLAGAHQAADNAGELALVAVEPVVVRGPLVFLGEMRDHRGSLVAAEIACYARESFLISRHCIGERGILLHVRFAFANDLRRVRKLVPF